MTNRYIPGHRLHNSGRNAHADQTPYTCFAFLGMKNFPTKVNKTLCLINIFCFYACVRNVDRLSSLYVLVEDRSPLGEGETVFLHAGKGKRPEFEGKKVNLDSSSTPIISCLIKQSTVNKLALCPNTNQSISDRKLLLLDIASRLGDECMSNRCGQVGNYLT